MAFAVMAMMGVRRPGGSVARIRRVATSPSITGIWTSISTTSNVAAAMASTASRPLATQVTVTPTCSSMVRASTLLISLSSASSTRPVETSGSSSVWSAPSSAAGGRSLPSA